MFFCKTGKIELRNLNKEHYANWMNKSSHRDGSRRYRMQQRSVVDFCRFQLSYDHGDFFVDSRVKRARC